MSLGRHVRNLCIASALPVAVIAWHFPYATDDPVRREDAIRDFYQASYSDSDVVLTDAYLAKPGKPAYEAFDIPGHVRRFVEQYDLQDAAVLDVGSGRGLLQDLVQDYTGLDIAASAAKNYHKPFVVGTATAMPFADNEFDAVWSIWVLEHIPNPEAALTEMRRVVRPGGYLYLLPAWDCKPWAAQGYKVRPYGDFGLAGRLVKASIPVRESESFWLFTAVPNRLVRAAFSGPGPTRLHYRRLEPNFAEYWDHDSDAVNDLDEVEVARWFESRGDTCLNCLPGWWRHLQRNTPIVIQVDKDADHIQLAAPEFLE